MLVLSRKVGESVLIGDNIEIKLLEIRDGRIKFGIDAPREVSVLRKEVIDTTKENREAGKNAATKSKLSDLMKNI